MTEPLPDPLVPAEVDLRDFAFMPLDVRRLRDSRLISIRKPEEVVMAILLWSASWHQQPASSLPDDDMELSQLAGCGRVVKEFQRFKPGAMHGLILCSDGRWYHPVVAEKAAEGWNAKLKEAHKRACDRQRKENRERAERKELELPMPASPALLEMGKQSDGIPIWRYRNSVGKGNNSDGKEKNSGGKSDDSGGIPADDTRNSRLKGQGQCKGQGSTPKSKASTAGAAAGTPKPPDPVKDEIWKTGRQVLEGEGKNRDAAGSFLGKLCKDYGQVLVLNAIRDCVTLTPAKPSEWLVARCQERRANAANKQLSLEERNRQATAGWKPPELREGNAN